jgi:hypothetical protein
MKYDLNRWALSLVRNLSDRAGRICESKKEIRLNQTWQAPIVLGLLATTASAQTPSQPAQSNLPPVTVGAPSSSRPEAR